MLRKKFDLQDGEVAEARRAAPRYEINEVMVRLESSLFRDTAILINAGRLGFSVRSAINYPAGMELRLLIKDFPPLAGTVVWSIGGRLGARFHAPLNADLLWRLSEMRYKLD